MDQAPATENVTAKRLGVRAQKSTGKLPLGDRSSRPNGMSERLIAITSLTMPAPDDASSPADQGPVQGLKNMKASRSSRDDRTPVPEKRRQKLPAIASRRPCRSSVRRSTPEESDAEDTTHSSDQAVGQDALGERIHETKKSYQDFGFSVNLVFREEFFDFDPHGVSLGKPAAQTTLNEKILARLKARVKEIKEHFLRLTQGEGSAEEINLPRRLLLRKSIHPGLNNPEIISKTIYRQRKSCKDEMNLCDFEMYSSLIILRANNRQAVRSCCALYVRRADLLLV